MIPKLEDVLSFLESLAPSHLAEPWDNPGLQVAASVREIQKVFVSLDPTIEAIKRAAAGRAQLLLTHHPLLFSPPTSIDANHYPGDVVAEALTAGISVAALHTNLDAAKGGINDILAGLLDLKDVEVLEEQKHALEKSEGPEGAFSYVAPPDFSGAARAGMGRVGNLRKPCSLAEMVVRLKRALGKETLGVVGEDDRRIFRVAVLGGSGGSLIPRAAEKRADLFLTGDVGHHHALEARTLGIALIDGGHFATENAALGLFSKRLANAFREKNWEVVVEFGSNAVDPIRVV